MKIKTNEITIEWWCDRYGAEVFGDVVTILREYDLFHFDVPHQSTLGWLPSNSEGEMWFEFQSAHNFVDEDFLRIGNAIASLGGVRLKTLKHDIS